MKVNLIKFYTYLILAIHLALNLILLNLPLTNILGYEFSAINALFAFISGGFVFLLNKKGDESFFATLGNIGLFSVLILVLPVLIVSINQAVLGICPFSTEILFYLIITIPAYFIAIFIADFFSLFRFRYLSFFIIVLFLLAEPIFEIYFYYQIYFYHPIIGFFPGNIYDENISIETTLVIYRVITILIFVLFGSVRYLSKKTLNKYRYLVILAPLILYFMFLFVKPKLGFATDKSRIESFLSANTITEHFDIHFTPDVPKETRIIISELHEFHFSDLNEKYGFVSDKRIASYVFGKRSTKKEIFGAGNADVSKPWMNSIFTDSDNYFNSLRHELIHTLLAQYGVTPFKIAEGFNPSLIEGYAMAFENNFNDKSVHYLSWLAREAGYNFSIPDLFKGFNFFSQNTSFSYIVSGSFIKYLSQKYPIEDIFSLYGDSDFRKYFGKSIEELAIDYNEFLDSLEYKLNPTEANLYFGRKPLIKKICPRYTARKLSEAQKLFSYGDYSNSAHIYKNLHEITKTYAALIGWTESLVKTGKVIEAKEILSDEFVKYDSTSYMQNILLRLGDYNVLIEDYENALVNYNKLIKLDPTNYYKSLVFLRKELIQRNPVKCLEYVKGSNYDRYSIINSIFGENIPVNYINIARRLSERLEENYKLFLTKFVNKLENDTFESSIVALDLAKYSIDNGDLQLAASFLGDALIYKDKPEHSEIIDQYITMVDWLIAHSDQSEMEHRKN